MVCTNKTYWHKRTYRNLLQHRVDYFGESEEYIDHDFGIDGAKGYAFSFRECLKIANPIWKWMYEGGIDLIVPVFLAKIIFLKNTIKANKAFEKYLIDKE